MPDRENIRTGLEEAPVFYANSVDILLSVYDLQMILGQIEEASSERLVAKVVARVMVSPQHAKALAEALATNIKKYEEMFGHIPGAPNPPPGGQS